MRTEKEIRSFRDGLREEHKLRRMQLMERGFVGEMLTNENVLANIAMRIEQLNWTLGEVEPELESLVEFIAKRNPNL